ncbi:hypothetical protein HGRIS_012451 [Hohenbuehelia grisea]|uniref:Proteophosphoglycan ppg4 n=1 Tax=Hohenbuehelia grisea TaxID=104357 RepID=A0ABR3ISA5_9AGAR
MAGLSPARRLRTKTTEFSDFFRGSSHNSRAQAFPSANDAPRDKHSGLRSASNATLEVPHNEASTSSTSKKFSSKLPFLGRTRKKSNVEEAATNTVRDGRRHETAQSPAAVSTMADFADASPDIAGRPSKSRDAVSTSEPPAQTLGSKFAAHFTPSKARKPDPPPKPTPVKPRKSVSPPSGNLRPPAQSPRSLASFESNSSGGSDNRSTTPRPAQPTFNVSISPPEDLSRYADLFTLPSSSKLANRQFGLSSREPSILEGSQSTRSSASDAAPVTPESPVASSSLPNPEVSDAPEFHPSILEDPPVRPGSRSSVKSTGKHHRPGAEDIDPQGFLRLSEDSVIEKDRVVPPRPNTRQSSPPSPVERRSNSSRIPSPLSERPSTSPRGSSIGRARSGSGSRPNPPPTIPLPTPPPSSPPPTSALPSVPTLPSTAPSRKSVGSISSISSFQSGNNSRRSRANTLSSVPSSPLIASPYPPSPALAPQPKFLRALKHDMATDSEKSDWDRSDWDRSDIENIDSATPEQLRQAVVVQNLRLGELTQYCHQLTTRHQAEKAAMERKIETLERDAARRDHEIKGLRWLVTDGRSATPNTAALPIGTPRQSPASDSEKPKKRSVVPGSQSDGGRMTDDSEAESVGMLSPSLRRNRTIGSPASRMAAVRSTSTRVPAKGLGYELAVARAHGAAADKRASMSSFSSASTSSTSSLMPASSVAPSTISSSLSSIPETPPPLPVKALASRPGVGKDDASAASSTNSARRSPRAPALTPAAAYAATLKKGRPPSIAQVLNATPSTDDVDKTNLPVNVRASSSMAIVYQIFYSYEGR